LKKLTMKGFTLVELMIVVAIIGILSAIAIPNFMKFQAKSKQSEAKTNLKAAYSAETTFLGANDQYGTFSGAGYAPERGNRYSYTIDPAALESQNRELTGLLPGVSNTAANHFGGGFDQYQVDCFKLVGGVCTPTTPALPVAGGTTIGYTAPAYANETPGMVAAPAAAPAINWGAGGGAIVQAIGNVDNDAAGDTWEIGLQISITTALTSCSDPSNSPSGIPANTYNDVNCD
jgi:type IV pilus assembly protein PilA